MEIVDWLGIAAIIMMMIIACIWTAIVMADYHEFDEINRKDDDDE